MRCILWNFLMKHFVLLIVRVCLSLADMRPRGKSYAFFILVFSLLNVNISLSIRILCEMASPTYLQDLLEYLV